MIISKKLSESVSWEFLLNNRTVNRQVTIFTETIIIFFSNLVPNKLVSFDDHDPPWINDFVKKNKMETPNIQNL